ncbi:WhiB family transcriptional regulator [Mycobacterium sp. URHB0044]|uniref:WhiB family transcriptional regulator n=1 Tax=Mycobacterium sp. URHB0044 TaxID=1380386 RepID=UPI0006866BA9|nr:WhiB family transcriptional regulator [Mycobacterium sp. URHB0044]
MVSPSSAIPKQTGVRPPRPIVEDWMWQQRGRCLDLPSDVFFPEDATRRNRRAHEERAKRICLDCPVITECREHAMRTPEAYGIWGATTPRERANA